MACQARLFENGSIGDSGVKIKGEDMPRPKKFYSLKEIQRKTGISYPTLIKYAQEHADEIPAVGEGRRRRYPRQALKAFQRIYSKGRPGRKSGEAWKGANPAPSELLSAPAGPLSEEDRQLIRDLLEAINDLRGLLRASGAAGTPPLS